MRLPGPGHHVGDTETAADLDQLAAADGDVPAFGEAAEAEQNGSGAVVDDDGVFGAAGLAISAPAVAMREPRWPVVRSSSRLV